MPIFHLDGHPFAEKDFGYGKIVVFGKEWVGYALCKETPHRWGVVFTRDNQLGLDHDHFFNDASTSTEWINAAPTENGKPIRFEGDDAQNFVMFELIRQVLHKDKELIIRRARHSEATRVMSSIEEHLEQASKILGEIDHRDDGMDMTSLERLRSALHNFETAVGDLDAIEE